MSDPQAYFERLGRLIEGRWSASYFDERTLPSIAVAALSEEPPHEFVSDEDIARWAIMAESLGRQPNADFNFGEPPLTVFAGRRFYIEALYWLDGTTSIHQHAFDGAFCVLGGGSVHSTYSFEERDRLSSRLILGDLLHQNSEILRPGSVRAINAGGGFIHSLFHYQRPSVSIVVRTYSTPGVPVQYSYDPPHVGLAPFDKEVWSKRAHDFVNVAIRCGWRSSADLVRDAMRNSDDLSAYQLLLDLRLRLPDGDMEEASGPTSPSLAALLEAYAAATVHARQRFGVHASAIFASCEEKRRVRGITALREQVQGEAHRQFLALLMNVPERSRLLELVGENFPGSNAPDQVCTWLRELTGDDALADYELGEDVIQLTRSLLLNESMSQTLQQFSQRHGRAMTKRDEEELTETIHALKETSFFRSLLLDEPPPRYDRLVENQRSAGL
jgi:hypothetical protein